MMIKSKIKSTLRLMSAKLRLQDGLYRVLRLMFRLAMGRRAQLVKFVDELQTFFIANKMTDEAIACFQISSILTPTTARSLNRQGELARRHGWNSQAIFSFLRALEVDPAQFAALANAVNWYLEHCFPFKALAVIDSLPITESSPDQRESVLRLVLLHCARQALAAGHMDQMHLYVRRWAEVGGAEASPANQLVGSDPDSSLGGDGIRSVLEKAIDYENRDRDINTFLSTVARQQGESDISHEENLKIRISQACNAGKISEALWLANQAVSHYPKAVWVLKALGYINIALNEMDDALHYYESALAEAPEDSSIIDRIGCIHFQKQDYQQVIDLSKNLIAQDANHESAYVNLAMTALRLNRVDEAISMLRGYRGDASPTTRVVLDYLETLCEYVSGGVAAPSPDVQSWTSQTPRKDRYILAITVFGDEYVNDLLTIALPSLLSCGNLDYWSEHTDTVIDIATETTRVEFILNHPIIQEMKKFVAVEVRAIPDILVLVPRLRYLLLSATHVLAIKRARAHGAGIIFWAPDMVVSAGFLRMLHRYTGSGKDALFYCHHRLDKFAFEGLPELASYRKGNALEIPAADLQRLGMKTLAPFLSLNHYKNGGVMNTWPYHLDWPLPDGGLLTHGYHHHPILFTGECLKAFTAGWFYTNDADFVSFLPSWNPDFSRCCVIPDGNEAISFELTIGNLVLPVQPTVPPTTPDAVIALYGTSFDAVHRWMFTQPVTYTTLPDAEIQNISDTAASAVASICQQIDQIHAVTGERPYVAGYAPLHSGGYPEIPLKL